MCMCVHFGVSAECVCICVRIDFSSSMCMCSFMCIHDDMLDMSQIAIIIWKDKSVPNHLCKSFLVQRMPKSRKTLAFCEGTKRCFPIIVGFKNRFFKIIKLK